MRTTPCVWIASMCDSFLQPCGSCKTTKPAQFSLKAKKTTNFAVLITAKRAGVISEIAAALDCVCGGKDSCVLPSYLPQNIIRNAVGWKLARAAVETEVKPPVR